MKSPGHIPFVQIIGEADHPDFRDAIGLLRREAYLVADERLPPELIVVAQSRPDVIRCDELDAIRRAAPLAGIVALLGSWCEGETRTGRPWPGAHRVYWYDFPAWWSRQMWLRGTGRCPDWARPVNFGWRATLQAMPVDIGLSACEPERPRPRGGLIILQTAIQETANTLADVLKNAGYATTWQRPDRPRRIIRGAVAGVWDGGQLDDQEAAELSELCSLLSCEGAPVTALIDFPRRDRVERALQVGAAAVLGKPWFNSDLIATLDAAIVVPRQSRAA
ncbi:MAG TPA: hypothetical protein VHE81_08175 [Lacipirellulaceae bacterium]|nr:hypothetical protein [Lacipirellulaceae bacterium]